jgi:methanogenic corrinoid protein MtbC1
VIKWCSYCQSYIGEAPPFEKMAITHGICASCLASGAERKGAASAGTVRLRDFFAAMRRAVRDGGIPEASEWIDRGVKAGLKPADMLIGVVQPALYEIGELWSKGGVTVSYEHRFSAFAEALAGLIYEKYPALRANRQNARPDILLTCADGNYHTLGIKFLEVMLLSKGYRTFTVLPGLPSRETADMALEMKCPAVGVSVSMTPQLEALRELSAELGAGSRKEAPRLIAGGMPIKEGVALPPELGVEACADITALEL